MLGIVVLNFNGASTTLECMNKIRAMKGQFRIVLVENGSRDDSFEKLRAQLPMSWDFQCLEWGQIPNHEMKSEKALTLVRVFPNRGFAGGCNVGAEVAFQLKCESVFFFNNDAWCVNDSFEELLRVQSENPRSIVGSTAIDPKTKQYSFSGRSWPGVLYGQGVQKVPSQPAVWQTGYVEGSGLLITKEIYDRILQAAGSEDQYFSDYAFHSPTFPHKPSRSPAQTDWRMIAGRFLRRTCKPTREAT